jgi:hypothetical protein
LDNLRKIAKGYYKYKLSLVDGGESGLVDNPSIPRVPINPPEPEAGSELYNAELDAPSVAPVVNPPLPKPIPGTTDWTDPLSKNTLGTLGTDWFGGGLGPPVKEIVMMVGKRRAIFDANTKDAKGNPTFIRYAD